MPIVFVQVADPVAERLVASLARPGGNITGFSNAEYAIGGKKLEVLKEVAPDVTHARARLLPGPLTGRLHLELDHGGWW